MGASCCLLTGAYTSIATSPNELAIGFVVLMLMAFVLTHMFYSLVVLAEANAT